MSGAIPILTYLQLSYLLTQLIYARTKSPQKGLFHKTWNMTNDCVSVTKTLMMGVKLMTERCKKNTHIKCKGQFKDKCLKKNSYIFLNNNDYKTPYIDIHIHLLSINFNLLSVLQYYAYQINDLEIYTSLTTILQLNALLFLT